MDTDWLILSDMWLGCWVNFPAKIVIRYLSDSEHLASLCPQHVPLCWESWTAQDTEGGSKAHPETGPPGLLTP